MTNEHQPRLQQFVEWCKQHISGDEKGEAQIFLDHLFFAFGHEGLKEAGAVCEMRVKKAEKGTSFADLVWKPIVLIEMKKRGEDLAKHYSQAFNYWTHLVPNRPSYVILCNFDEFWIYDFNSQMDSPVDKVLLSDLPERYGPLAFMFPDKRTPVFGNHQESVTRQAADQLVLLFRSLIERSIDRKLAQRFTLQTLMVLFAEDIGLLERYFFTRILDDCTTPEAAFDLIGQLFIEMNTPGVTSGGRFKGVKYFNGGLFSEPARIELTHDEINLLKEAAKFDWSKVRPEIFGVIFEHSMDSEERHAYGAHYTSPVDIMKVVGPTIVEPWQQRINKAKTLKELETLLMQIENFKVLDPACGSGNFLYIAYRELKRIESIIYERMGEFKSIDASQRPIGFVNTQNFYGIDINPFAVELAKVTMMLAHKLAIDELHIQEQALPLDNLDSNFVIGDALIDTAGSPTPWPEADVIIGNPPFLGAKLIKREYGVEYTTRLRKAYPDIPGMADLCVFWFYRSNEHLSECTKEHWTSGRAGLVGTQNIRNNASRVGGLDKICSSGIIIEAVDNQPWSGEAKVHVSIANWVKTKNPKLLPKAKRLWFHTEQKAGTKRKASQECTLNKRDAKHINSSLSDKVDLSTAKKLSCNAQVVTCQGITPGHAGFLLSKASAETIPTTEQQFVHPYLVGDDILSGNNISRYIIDLNSKDLLEIQAYKSLFSHLEDKVLPDLIEKSEDSDRVDSKDYWWRHWRPRKELISAIDHIPRYLACSRVTKRPIFVFVDSNIYPGDALQVFAFADDYSFGIMQSIAHYAWFHAKCSNFKSDPRYTSDSVFSTFPWPQNPKTIHIDAVVKAARHLMKVRRQFSGNLRELYKTLTLVGKNPLQEAHFALDTAVLKAYGFNHKKDVLAQLLELNKMIESKIATGEDVMGPGIPPNYPTPAKLVSQEAFGK